jgi:hypothetical protein
VITPAAKRLYMQGEEHYAKGDYANAVALWRHALLQLPRTPDADELRHKLILRMAHGQLAAYHATADANYLLQAQGMLERYAEKHEALFGDDPEAMKERGDVWEILHEVELRLEPERFADEESADAVVETTEVADASPNEPEGTTDTKVARARASQPVDTHEGEAVGGNIHRDVVVDTRSRTSIDDPVVRQRLATEFSTGWGGPFLTAAGVAMLHGPRPLVRVSGLPKVVEHAASPSAARRTAWRVVREVRPQLEQCYADAYARRPVDVTDATVSITIDERGEVSRVTLVDGGLVDGDGDACLLDVVDEVRVEPEAPAIARVEVPFRFFYQGARGMSETFDPKDPPTAGAESPGLPPTDSMPAPQKITRGRPF